MTFIFAPTMPLLEHVSGASGTFPSMSRGEEFREGEALPLERLPDAPVRFRSA
jgi:hypothetical protein